MKRDGEPLDSLSVSYGKVITHSEREKAEPVDQMAEIIVDEKIRFGKPVIKGTRITVDEVLGALAGGMSFEAVEREFKVKRADILAALEYATKIVSEERVGSLKVTQ